MRSAVVVVEMGDYYAKHREHDDDDNAISGDFT